jgi:CRP/FNR family transcriptional regulator, cyclic AMP receptor protein
MAARTGSVSNGTVSDLSKTSQEALSAVSMAVGQRAGDILFSEEELAKGVFILHQGKVKISTSSSDGKTLILRIATAGAVLGLSSVIQNKPQETTAQVLETSRLSFVRRADLLRLMSEHGDVTLQMAKELSLEYAGLCQELATIGLQRSAVSRLAQLFIGWSESAKLDLTNIEIECSLTHEVIAQLIGTSRETVTRILHDFRVGEIATLKNEFLTIHDTRKLRALTTN